MSTTTDQPDSELCALPYVEKQDPKSSTATTLVSKYRSIFMLALFYGYSIWALVINVYRATFILVLVIIVTTALLTSAIEHRYHDELGNTWSRVSTTVSHNWSTKVLLRRTVYQLLLTAVVVYLMLRIIDRPNRLVSLGGLLTFVSLCYVFSWNRRKVVWRPVLWGFALQFCFALFIIRTEAGYSAFAFLGLQIKILLQYTNEGAGFVFGELATGIKLNEREEAIRIFAFQVMPTIIFFSSIVSVLYYLGVMQRVMQVLAVGMKYTLGTSAPESLNAAGNIFVGLTEAPLLIRPFLKTMTRSELHAVMTGGFATIAGAVMAIYISFGVDPCHLLTASVMSAPAALAISKIVYPEDEERERDNDEQTLADMNSCTSHTNIIEAAADGASMAVGFVGNIVAMLISFLSLIGMLDVWVAYLGSRVGYPDVSLTKITGYCFYPIAAMMGVPLEDCEIVGELLGLKIIVNEFVAYTKLMEYQKQNVLSKHSILISTYALCGFSNFATIGMTIGGMLPLAPTRSRDFAELVLSSMIAGNVVCFVTACIAAMLSDV